jgi:ribonuclease J
VIFTTFASHIHRLQQVFDAAAAAGKKIHLTGRSLVTTVGVASSLGRLKIPSDILIDAGQLRLLPAERIVILTTGSQGEPLSALARIASGVHKHVKVQPRDRIIVSARVIPGHEKSVARMVNTLILRGADVIYQQIAPVHVSGHASAEELITMIDTVRPRHLIPIHGEPRHLRSHGRLAARTSLSEEEVLLARNGDRLRFEKDGVFRAGRVPAGRILVDGRGGGSDEDPLLRQRRKMSRNGVVTVTFVFDTARGALAGPPALSFRGVAFEQEQDRLLAGARSALAPLIKEEGGNSPGKREDLRGRAGKILRRYFEESVERFPVIVTDIIDI